jgi:hypothetical protein
MFGGPTLRLAPQDAEPNELLEPAEALRGPTVAARAAS